MKRIAKALWSGTEGKGELTTQSETLNKTNYSFKTRLAGEERGANPEELLAAAHAACFTTTVSFALAEKGLNLLSMSTKAALPTEGFVINGIHLSITGSVFSL